MDYREPESLLSSEIDSPVTLEIKEISEPALSIFLATSIVLLAVKHYT
jgi:hypothetical protein